MAPSSSSSLALAASLCRQLSDAGYKSFRPNEMGSILNHPSQNALAPKRRFSYSPTGIPSFALQQFPCFVRWR